RARGRVFDGSREGRDSVAARPAGSRERGRFRRERDHVRRTSPLPSLILLALAAAARGQSPGALFQVPAIEVGDGPRTLPPADLDVDGVPDAVVGNWADGTISLLAGRGDGSFTLAGTLPGG